MALHARPGLVGALPDFPLISVAEARATEASRRVVGFDIIAFFSSGLYWSSPLAGRMSLFSVHRHEFSIAFVADVADISATVTPRFRLMD